MSDTTNALKELEDAILFAEKEGDSLEKEAGWFDGVRNMGNTVRNMMGGGPTPQQLDTQLNASFKLITNTVRSNLLTLQQAVNAARQELQRVGKQQGAWGTGLNPHAAATLQQLVRQMNQLGTKVQQDNKLFRDVLQTANQIASQVPPAASKGKTKGTATAVPSQAPTATPAAGVAGAAAAPMEAAAGSKRPALRVLTASAGSSESLED